MITERIIGDVIFELVLEGRGRVSVWDGGREGHSRQKNINKSPRAPFQNNE